MEADRRFTYITIDPPYRIASDAVTHTFVGWAEVDDEAQPALSMTVNGLDVPVTCVERPGVKTYFPNLQTTGFWAQVNFADLLRGAPSSAVREPFLLVVEIRSGDRVRAFEFAVTDAWLQRILSRPMTARRIPPEALQIRVTGDAAGEFHRTGRTTAEQIAGVLAAMDHPLQSHARVLDFGCGPGRVLDCVRDMHPGGELHGCDIDAEAIGWAAENLGERAAFRVNPLSPPLPYEDESFDLVYAVSVFTHLPEDLQRAWLFELRRVVKPGGLVLTTKLDAGEYDLVPEPVKQLAAETGFAYWGEADLTDGLPDVYRLAYHTDAYVERVWGTYFEVLHIGSHDINRTQDAVLMRRPRHPLSWLPTKLRKRLHALAAG